MFTGLEGATVTIHIKDPKTGVITELYGVVDQLELTQERPYNYISAMDGHWKVDVPGRMNRKFNVRGFCIDEPPKDQRRKPDPSRGRWSDIAEEL